MPVDHATPDEVAFWDELLADNGLSMNAGLNPKWLKYGWQYREADRVCEYNNDAKRRDMRGGIRKKAGRKALCVKNFSPRCGCSDCVKTTEQSNGTLLEGNL